MKQWHQSLAIRGALLAIIAAVLRFFGIDHVEAELTTLVDALLTLATAIGGVLAIIGRVRANKQIGPSGHNQEEVQ